MAVSSLPLAGEGWGEGFSRFSPDEATPSLPRKGEGTEPPGHCCNDRRCNGASSQRRPKKSAGVSSGGSLLSRDLLAYAFMFAFTASAVIGNERTRAPQALKIALPIAGATTVTAAPPTTVAFS